MLTILFNLFHSTVQKIRRAQGMIRKTWRDIIPRYFLRDCIWRLDRKNKRAHEGGGKTGRSAFMPVNGMFYTRRYCGHSVTGGQKERKRRRRGIADKYSPSLLLPDVSAEESVRFRDLDRSRREKKVKGAKRPFGDIKENGHYLRRPPRRMSPITLRIDWLDGIHLLPKFFDFLIDNFSLELMRDSPWSYHDLA